MQKLAEQETQRIQVPSKAARSLANGKIPPFWNDRNYRQRTKWRVSRETVELGKSRGSVAFQIWDSSGRYSFCSSGVHSVERLRPRAQSVVWPGTRLRRKISIPSVLLLWLDRELGSVNKALNPGRYWKRKKRKGNITVVRGCDFSWCKGERLVKI